MIRRFAKATPISSGAVGVAAYARWCSDAYRTSLDPRVSILRARSLVAPSLAHPATAGATSEDDPRVQWREHWDATTRKPYYENLVTREVTFDIPEAFPTRFGAFWVGKGFNVLENIVQPKEGSAGAEGSTPRAAASTSASAGSSDASSSTVKTQMRQFSTTRRANGVAPPPEGTDPAKMTMKQRIGLYGTAGLVLYLIIHNILLACIFITLYVFEVDLVSIARGWGYELKFLPGGKHTPKEESEEAAAVEEISNDPSIIATFITAVALCKLVVPFQLTITLALCPTLAPRLNVLIQRWKARRGTAPRMTETPPV